MRIVKVFKDKQFLTFVLEDNKTVKYDFATKTAIGKTGKNVKNLCVQLSGNTINDIINVCENERYGKFLAFVRDNCGRGSTPVENIGTILDRVPQFSNFEQIFSAGIDCVVSKNFKYTINEIPKALIKLCRNHSITLSNNFLNYYKENPDGYLLAYNLDYMSLNDYDIRDILFEEKSVWNRQTYSHEYHSVFNNLVHTYGYTTKSLLLYIDYLKTFEAIESMHYVLNEITDYCRMMSAISNKFDRYPRHFLTTHRIATRNYNRLKREYPENLFTKRINLSMEKTFGEYTFIYPKTIQDIKDEAVQQNNCVSSYIDNVIDGKCDILFLRKKDSPEKSLVTIEVRDGAIVQALQRFNNPLTPEQKEVVDRWNKWYSNKSKESEELKNVS